MEKDFKYPTKKQDWMESDENPIIKFDIYLSFYKTTLIWKQILVLQKKYENIFRRRKLFNKEDKAEYIAECVKQHKEFNTFEEDCL